jgi:hypothetical protein
MRILPDLQPYRQPAIKTYADPMDKLIGLADEQGIFTTCFGRILGLSGEREWPPKKQLALLASQKNC